MRLPLASLSLTLSLLAPVRAQAQDLDLQKLFSTGVLSPDYPRQHARSSAQPIALASRRPVLVLQVNPALAPLGVWSFRAEIAPVAYVSLLLDYSRIRGLAVPGFDDRIHLDAGVLDVALHLWPDGEAARGLYFGPHLARGSGDDRDGLGSGKLSGWGVDLGYQWVLGPASFNLGAGFGRFTAAISPSASTPPEVLASAEHVFLRPYLTTALGLAF